MDLDLFACDETGMRCILVENFPLPRALMVWQYEWVRLGTLIVRIALATTFKISDPVYSSICFGYSKMLSMILD